MNCPFCAEEIQDAAVLCRFCGARMQAGQWCPPGGPQPSAPRPKGSFTIKTAGVFFLLSGVFSLVWATSEVPLFGAMRGGLLAVAYNLIYAALFLGMGIGLIIGKPWAYSLLMAGTALYSLDQLLFVLDKDTRAAYLAASPIIKQVAVLVDTSMFDQWLIVMSATTLACWWGFAFYIYLRRDYFQVR